MGFYFNLFPNMIRCYALISFIGISLLISKAAQCQHRAVDSANITIAAYYHQAINQASGLYNGIEYQFHAPNIVGNAFFLNNDWNQGSVVYEQVLYPKVPLRYDLVEDQLIALSYTEVLPYVLNRDKVQSFNIANHHFVYVPADSLQKSFDSGFYEQLYNGKTEVLVRRTETISTTSGLTSLESKYNGKTRYYIMNKGLFYDVSGNGSVVSALKDKKREVQQFIKTNHIKAQKNPVEALVQIAAYYDTLNP